jgi:hypothetical protein
MWSASKQATAAACPFATCVTEAERWGSANVANPVRRRWLFREAIKPLFAKRDEMLGRHRVLEVPWTAGAGAPP